MSAELLVGNMGMEARLPSLYRIWVVLLKSELAAKAPGKSVVPIPAMGFTSRDIAPCCARMCRQVLGTNLGVVVFASAYVR